MTRVRRTRAKVEEEAAEEQRVRVRRTRAVVVEEPEGTDDEEEDDEDDGGLDLSESPDNPLEGETKMEAGDRIEEKYRKRAKSPLKAIRAFCVMCMGCYPRDVARCSATRCVLYPFRFGRNPFQKHGPKK